MRNWRDIRGAGDGSPCERDHHIPNITVLKSEMPYHGGGHGVVMGWPDVSPKFTQIHT